MRTTARVFEFIPVGRARRLALVLLAVAALGAASSGCGTGSEALPSNLPPPSGGGALIITTTTMEDGVINRSYSKTLDTAGGTPPLISCTFSAGTPPPGLNVAPSGSTCVVSGFPSMAGSFSFTVRAEDSNNISDTQDYTVAIRDEFTITGMAPDPLPDGVEDAAYNFVIIVTTDTVTGPDDFGEVAENGNGPITMCTLGGLPAGMMAMGGAFTANGCQVLISGAPNIGIAPMGAPMLFQLTLSVTDTGIGGSSTPPGTVTQMAIDLTIQPPVSITLITTDVGMTTGCTGGTFDDSTGGGAAPDGVTGRVYGDPQCDLLFGVTGGIVPYTWTDNSAMPPAPFGCAQEGVNGEFFRCNSGMAALMTAGGLATDVTVEVMDSGPGAPMGSAATTQGTDIFGHASHSIFVNDPVAVGSDLGDPLPDAVMGQMYGEAPGVPASFTATDGLGAVGGYAFSTTTGLAAPGMGFPDTIGCNQTAPDTNACATNVSTITAMTGLYEPTMQATDVANDTTPSGMGSVMVDLTVLAPLTFSLITADAVTTTPCTGGAFDDSTFGGNAPDAVTGRTYGDPECDLLFTASGARAPYTWNTNSAAPAPIACTQEGVNGEFFRCNSGGGAVTGATAILGVDVTDAANLAVPAITENTDDQMHMGHMITLQPEIVLNLITADAGTFTACTGGTFTDTTGDVPTGVFGRTYGGPARCDLLFRASGGVPDAVNGYSWGGGGPAELVCAEDTELVMDDRFRCNTGGAGFSVSGLFIVQAAPGDAGNDTTPSFVQTTDDQGHTNGVTSAHNININTEISVVSDLGGALPDAVQGQPYGEAPGMPATFTASNGLGGYVFSTTTGGMNNGDMAFPDTIGCMTAGNVFSCATNASNITAGVGTYLPTVDADDTANDTTPDSVTAMSTASAPVSIDVIAAMMFTLITADAGTTMACTGGTFADTTGDGPDAVTGRTYGDPECDLLFQVTGGRAPYTWNTNSAAPGPIACAQEGADNEFFRCNSGGGGVAGGTSTLGVDVTDMGSSTLAALNVFIDDQGHGGHMINVRDEFAPASFMASPPGPGGGPQAGVTGRPYGTPTGSQDLVISIPLNTGVGPVIMTPDENDAAGDSAAAGFPNDLDCIQTMDRELTCTTGAGVITDAAGIYSPVLTATDTGNDTTPSGGIGSNPFNIRIVDEITINNLFLTNGVAGQSYTQTLTCETMSGFCGGTGNPDFINATYAWGETNTMNLCPPDAPANPDITVSTPNPSNPSTGEYSSVAPTANTGTFMPGICVTDNGNDVTPSCDAAGTCPFFQPTYSVFDAVAAIDASNNEVDIFDTNTATFNAASFNLGNNVTLDMGSTPFRSTFTPNGSFLVVVDPAENEADIINVATGAITSVTGLSSAGGDPTAVVIGPASNPLTNPDSWRAYVANPTTGSVDVIDVDPNSGTFGTVIAAMLAPGAKDLAITPTFAGPDTRLYTLSGTDLVCAFDAQPGSPTFGLPIDIDPGAGTCIDTSAIPGDTQFIEITPNGLQAIITKHDGVGSPAGAAQLVRIDTDPTSMTRDTITANVDIGATVFAATGTRGCWLPNDLRSQPPSGQFLVACGTDLLLGDALAQFDTSNLAFAFLIPLTVGDDPQDVAWTISGGEAIVSLKGISSIRRFVAGVTTALPNVTAPDGVDHIRDPQLNALVSAAFPLQAGPDNARAGKEFTSSLSVTGGVQPYTWSVAETSGTACQGLSLDTITGRISGTPVNIGTCSLTVEVTDSTPGAPQSRRVTKTITVE